MRKKEIDRLINEFIVGSPLNRIEEIGIDHIFDPALMGIAHAHDPLFAKLKEDSVIGAHHLLPTEWLPEAKAVISFFLPFSVEICEPNRHPGLPAQEWLYARIEGEVICNALREHIVEAVTKSGGKALAPVLDSRFALLERRSNWSERHAAFIAGLGTFSLSKSLITAKGCAGRYGSVIVSLPLEPTSRLYEELDAYCTMCGECINRCPCGAINTEGKNIATCAEYIDKQILPRFAPRYGCGKCQTAVQCERAAP